MPVAVEKRFYQGLLFDLNGTLVEIYKMSEYRQSLELLATTLGLELTRFERAWQHSWVKYPFGDYPSVRSRMLDALQFYFENNAHPIESKVIEQACEIRYQYIAQQQGRIRPGVLNTFKWAQNQGYKLGIVSNCSIENLIAWPGNPMASYIPDPTLSCKVKLSKPDIKIFRMALQNMGIQDPIRCIYIADGDDHEFESAKTLGMARILFKYPNIDAFRHEPFPEEPNTIEHFQDLPIAIEKLETFKRLICI